MEMLQFDLLQFTSLARTFRAHLVDNCFITLYLLWWVRIYLNRYYVVINFYRIISCLCHGTFGVSVIPLLPLRKRKIILHSKLDWLNCSHQTQRDRGVLVGGTNYVQSRTELFRQPFRSCVSSCRGCEHRTESCASAAGQL